MTITTFSNRQFYQEASKVIKAAEKREKIADLLVMPGIEDVELEIPQSRDLAQLAKIK